MNLSRWTLEDQHTVPIADYNSNSHLHHQRNYDMTFPSHGPSTYCDNCIPIHNLFLKMETERRELYCRHYDDYSQMAAQER